MNIYLNNISIRPAKRNDLKAIVRIYNQAIINTEATFDTKPKTVESQVEWFNEHSEKFPLMVAEGKDGRILGWASLSRWSDRCAYENTAESSVYVDQDHQGEGIGDILMSELYRLAKKNNIHVVIARISGQNETSIHLHQKYGFEHIGTMKEVGYKFNRYIDVHLMQLLFK